MCARARSSTVKHWAQAQDWSHVPSSVVFHFIYLFLVDVTDCSSERVWRSKDGFVELVLSFSLYRIPRIKLRSLDLCSKLLHQHESFRWPTTFFFKQGLSLVLEIPDSTAPAGQPSPGTLLLLSPSTRVTGMCCCVQLFFFLIIALGNRPCHCACTANPSPMELSPQPFKCLFWVIHTGCKH